MYKILKIVVAVLGLAGAGLLVRIMGAGDDAIKASALDGDTALVEPMMWVAYIVLALILGFVVFFVLKGLFTHTAELKNTLIGVGAFAAVAIISYVIATGVETPMRDGEILSAGGDKLVGAGLNMFYLLSVIAIGTMLFSGIKKMIK